MFIPLVTANTSDHYLTASPQIPRESFFDITTPLYRALRQHWCVTEAAPLDAWWHAVSILSLLYIPPVSHSRHDIPQAGMPMSLPPRFHISFSGNRGRCLIVEWFSIVVRTGASLSFLWPYWRLLLFWDSMICKLLLASLPPSPRPIFTSAPARL